MLNNYAIATFLKYRVSNTRYYKSITSTDVWYCELGLSAGIFISDLEAWVRVTTCLPVKLHLHRSEH
jgi:hypothetical protein